MNILVPLTISSILDIIGLENIIGDQVHELGLRVEHTPTYCNMYEKLICENGGLVEEIEGRYACKCQDDFYGVRCEKETFFKPISQLKRMFIDVNLRDGKPALWWLSLNHPLENIYEFHQNNIKKLETFTSIDYNGGLERNMTSTRILPPAHPIECTRASRLHLTPLVDIQKMLIQREPGAFKPDPNRRNMLLDTFYKYFILQFFDANFNFTVTASQLYGSDEQTRNDLRSFSDGKLKTNVLDGEQYPSSLSFSKRIEHFINRLFSMKSVSKSLWFNTIIYSSGRNKMDNRAVGHPMVNMDPALFVMSTLWVREHNRVCDVLRQKWPEWTDDELYNTARNIIIGEMMKIMMDEILNKHSAHSLHLEHIPRMIHNQFKNINNFTTPFELLLITMWPTSLPEPLNNTPTDTMFFNDNRQVMKYGLRNAIKHMVNQEIGMVTHGNYDDSAEPMTTLMMKLSRENALQSFNNYRRKLGLSAYRSFYDLTEDAKTARILEELYDNIESVELLTGMLTEKRQQGALSTVQIMTNSLLVISILTNPLNTKDSWRPEIFGGQEGFDMVQFANIEALVCNNLIDKCSDGFQVKLQTS